MKEVSCKIYVRKSKYQTSYFFYIPKSLLQDSAFPFSIDDELVMKIDGTKIIIEKKYKNSTKNI